MSDAERDRAQNTLNLLLETCSSAIEALQQLPLAVEPSPSASPSCAVLHKDYISLLTLVYTSTTKISLTLRAQEPAYTAALTPLRDLVTNITSLTTCATLFDPHGVTLASEARLTAKEVCQAVRALTVTILEGDDGYLIRTGAVHDLIDKARRELSMDNRAAVQKRWASDRGMMEDSLEEVASMVEVSGEDDEEGDFEDDEWDELGLGSGKKMSEEELDRARKIQPLFRFATLLHKRVQLDILNNKHSNEPSIKYLKTLDALPAHSHDLLLASEEIVASLYAPQDPLTITSAISLLTSSVQRLRTALTDGGFLPPAQSSENDVDALTGRIAAIDVRVGSNVNGQSKKKDVRKWFDTCFEQIDSLSRNLGDALQESSNET